MDIINCSISVMHASMNACPNNLHTNEMITKRPICKQNDFFQCDYSKCIPIEKMTLAGWSVVILKFLLDSFLLDSCWKRKIFSFYYPLSHYFFRVRIFRVVAIGFFSLSKSPFNQTEQHYSNNNKSISIWTRIKKSSLARFYCPLQIACYLIRIYLISFIPPIFVALKLGFVNTSRNHTMEYIYFSINTYW